MSEAFKITGEFTKLDENLGLVFGWGIICTKGGEDYFDLGGDHIPDQSMLVAAADFMQNSRIAGHMHKVADLDDPARTTESFKKVETRGSVIFAYPLTAELAKAHGIQCEQTGLLLAIKGDDAMMDGFRSGELTGFSIGGLRGDDEEVD